jgi:hypothetical protein
MATAILKLIDKEDGGVKCVLLYENDNPAELTPAETAGLALYTEIQRQHAERAQAMEALQAAARGVVAPRPASKPAWPLRVLRAFGRLG